MIQRKVIKRLVVVRRKIFLPIMFDTLTLVRRKVNLQYEIRRDAFIVLKVFFTYYEDWNNNENDLINSAKIIYLTFNCFKISNNKMSDKKFPFYEREFTQGLNVRFLRFRLIYILSSWLYLFFLAITLKEIEFLTKMY